ADALGQEGILETDADGTTVEATFAGEEESVSNPEDDGRPDGAEVLSELEMEALEDELEPSAEIDGEPAPVSARPAPEPGQPSYEELDEEFFPLDEPDAETPPTPAPEIPETIGSSKPTKPIAPPKNTEPPDPAALAEGGFL
ncbi:MAG: hypothetical protein K2H64_01110, partial [Desulfovibrio sp.]|nr:hypothetical protein [Desulfovibrio sp.]